MAPFSKAKYPRIETELAYVLDSHITKDEVVYREGDLVASSDPHVREEPALFAPAGLPTATYRAIRMERFMKHLVEVEEAAAR